MALDDALDAEERAAVTQLVRAGLVDPETAARARAVRVPVAEPAGTADDGRRAVG